MATGKIRFPEFPFPHDELDSFPKIQEYSEMMYTALVEDGLLRTEDLNTTDINTIGDVTCVNLNVSTTVTFNSLAYTWPATDGSSGDFLQTDGSLGLSWTSGGAPTTFVSLTDTPANYTGDATKVLFVNDAGNAVDFATNLKYDEGDDTLTLTSATAHGLRSIRSSSYSNILGSTLKLTHKTSGNMADKFGPALTFAIEDVAGVENVIGNIGCARDTADNSGALTFWTDDAGGSSEAVRIDHDENLLVGMHQSATCGGKMCLILQHGTAPTSSEAAAPILFSDPIATGSGIYCLNIRNTDGTRIRLRRNNYLSDPTNEATLIMWAASINDYLISTGLMASS